MNHDDLRLALSDLRDGELDARGRAEVRAHLEACLECAAAYRRMERLGALLQAPARAAGTEAFVAKVMRRLPPLRTPAPRPGVWDWLSPRWLAPALSVGAACMFLSIAIPDANALLDELFSGPAIEADAFELTTEDR